MELDYDMRKRNLKEGFKKIDFRAGFKGVKISSIVLFSLIMYFFAYLVFIGLSALQIFSIALEKPTGQDYFVIFAGFILFIIIPFIVGVKLKK